MVILGKSNVFLYKILKSTIARYVLTLQSIKYFVILQYEINF